MNKKPWLTCLREGVPLSDLVADAANKVHSYCQSSTRMEALAILGLHVACKYLNPKHLHQFHNSCDSTSAINTYNKLRTLNRMQLPSLPNSDDWRIIRMYLTNWGKIQHHHTPSHMDDFLDPEDMDDDFAHNVMADELADAYYCPDQPSVGNTELSVHLMGFFYHRNKPMTVPFRKWAHQHVRLNRSRSYYHVHHPLALKGVKIYWTSMQSVAK